MTDVIDTAATRTLTRSQVEDFLYREARLLDDRQWDEWITCYSPRVEYWMPAWDDLSLIHI